MRPKLLLLTLFALAFASWYPATAADGIRPDVHFTLPFAVDGTQAINRATVQIVDGKPILRVLYVKAGTIAELTYTLTRGDEPEPGPDPQPDPEPEPEPQPVPTDRLWGIIVEESLDRTPEQAVVYVSPKVRELFEWKRFRVIDVTGPVGNDMEPWRQRALRASCPTGTCPITAKPGAALPMLFLVDSASKIYYEGPPPGTVDLMVSLVEKTLKGGAK